MLKLTIASNGEELLSTAWNDVRAGRAQEDMEQAKAVALYEFGKRYPYSVKVRMNAQRMSSVWIVRMSWGPPPGESEYCIDADTGEAWKIK